jgi:hypothetical protein
MDCITSNTRIAQRTPLLLPPHARACFLRRYVDLSRSSLSLRFTIYTIVDRTNLTRMCDCVRRFSKGKPALSKAPIQSSPRVSST